MKENLYNVLTIVFVGAMLALNVAWIMSVTGCAARQTTPEFSLSTDFCIPQADQAKDPCELEFWEDQQFEQHGG
tara:strand:- start:1423 stop:1644 length:222 start_codon:yes stop_codon:yes gene_type:complete